MRWPELGAFPTITVKAGYGVRRRIEQAAMQGGLELRVAHEAALFTTALALATGGLGVAVVPESVVLGSPARGLVARRLVQPQLEKPTAFIFKKDRSLPPSAEAFMRLLLDHYEAE